MKYFMDKSFPIEETNKKTFMLHALVYISFFFAGVHQLLSTHPYRMTRIDNSKRFVDESSRLI